VSKEASRFGKSAALLAALLATGSIAAHASMLTTSPVVFRSGDWSVHRTRDARTDATVCTAFYRNNRAIQLGSHSLVIAVADAPRQVSLSFDGRGTAQARAPRALERAVGVVDMEGAEFDRLFDSTRLRYEVVTGTDGRVAGNIDLAGAPAAYANILSGCGGEPLADRR
jgi:hypothetical protein